MTLGVLSCGSLLAFSTLLHAQEFRAPDFSGAAPTIQQELLQQKQQHAEALKAQMMRAQREHGAPDGFAQKAFEAQQAYLAEQAYQEYQAYQAHSQKLQTEQEDFSQDPGVQPEVVQASYLQSARRLPKPNLQPDSYSVQAPAPVYRSPNQARPAQQMSQVPPTQATYSPPVHVTPPGVSVSFGDQPARDRTTQQYPMARSQNSGQRNVLPQPKPQPAANPRYAATQGQRYNVIPNSQYRQPANVAPQPIYNPYQQPAIRPTEPTEPTLIQRVAAQSRIQQPTQNQRPTQTQPPVQRQAQARQTQPPKAQAQRQAQVQSQTQQGLIQVQDDVFPPDFSQRVHGPNDPYVFDERPPVGLQDRIASLLSRPQYKELAPVGGSPIGLAQQSMENIRSRIGMRTQAQPAIAYPQTPATRQAPASRGLINRAAAAMASSSRSLANGNPPTQQHRHQHNVVQSNPPRRSQSEIRLAQQMEQRILASQRPQNSVQQVAMVAPVQDPFNEGKVRFSGGNEPIETPTLNAPANYPVQDRGVRARPISVLNRGRYQESEPNPDNSQFGIPNQDIPTIDENPISDVFGQKTDEELQKIDDELNRRLKELDANSQRNADEKSRLDGMAEQLEKEMAGEDPLDSVLSDDPTDDGFDDEPLGTDLATKPVAKSCAEFRSELLNSSIRDIALDISPPASSSRDQYIAISRSWTDRTGNVIATGTMVDLRRGYVILESGGGRQKIPYAKLSDADWAAISDYWKIPTLCSVGDRGAPIRNWVPQTFTWHATAICHKPLFFENIQLERYGHSHGPFTQPVHSVAHFFVSLATVPYRSAITPPNECQYALGFYRPGNCAPWLKEPVPISLDGVRRQARWTTAAALIP